MDKGEYRKAVKIAKRIMGFVTITEGRKAGVRLSKVQALSLIKALADDKPVLAEWADSDSMILFVG